MIPRHLLIGVTALLLLVVSMGVYLRQMRRQAVGLESPASAFPVAAPVSGPTETVTLYVADDAAGILRARPAQIPLPGGRQQRAEELLRALLRIYQQPGAASAGGGGWGGRSCASPRNRAPPIRWPRLRTFAASTSSIRALESSI